MKRVVAATKVACVLLFAVYSSYSIGDVNDPIFKPTVDARGFIDVWQLRHDVALVPDKAPDADEVDAGYYCNPDHDDGIEPSEKERKQEALFTKNCLGKIQRNSAEYKRIFAAFNRAWLPVMMEAIRKGDVVAEVIMRQCDTTPAFDRSDIDSTCDSGSKKSAALNRLKEIGFTPALHTCGDGRQTEEAAADTIYMPRAFTFYRSTDGKWKTDAFACLSLHRKPLTPGYLVWGWQLYYGGGNTLIRDWFDRTSTTMSAAEIDGYLKQDPRWGVFLLSRVGRHEWVPAGTQSTTHILDSAWLGQWELEKGTYDWTAKMSPRKGHAVIARNGEYTQITIQADEQKEPLLNVVDCTLRYSGGLTFTSEASSKGQIAAATSLGNFYLGGSGAGSGAYWDDGLIDEAVSPLDPKKQYKQVLMQCQNAESDSNVRIRFLLLAGDMLVEFATETAYESKLAVRHYRRVK